ncbi:hypothetical protein ACFFV7_23495 [Nonomuraea spiralis]|uniref:Uncharacterized protein n=1 Tax=Nonomuraea spiralis TaxID=46182 RepID=A0ABV5II05_9ACTN|nr:hypothetical protein [Nonomuraea spiralis]GGS95958.1 hypothetical protein GCM10010176_044790 [Nonomuraea spiralis]
MKIVLPLPAELTSLFVVAVEQLPFDVDRFVPWRVPGPYRKAARDALDDPPALVVSHRPSPWRSAEITLQGDERRRLRRAGEHVLVSTTAPPRRLPGAVQVARAVARALARQCDGLLIDPLTATAVPACPREPGEPRDFRLGDHWLTWDTQVHGDATCPPWDPSGTAECDCLRVTSRGLSRFALPEITLDGVACAHSRCATGLLRSVAHRLVADQLAHLKAHPLATCHEIDDLLRIQPSGPFRGGPPFGVRLTPCETERGEPGRTGRIRRLKVGPAPGTGRLTCLRVGPPSGFTGSLNDWLCTAHDVRPALAA